MHLIVARRDLTLDAATPRAGEEAELRFTITRAGEPVRTEPYLGAGDFPTQGRYRLFLQFKHAGAVRTVAFTQQVG
jgi:hypothetical protein